MSAETFWRAQLLRQIVVLKIDEAIRNSGTTFFRSSNDLEDFVFRKAKNRAEYLGRIVQIISHFRELGRKTRAGMNQGQSGSGMSHPSYKSISTQTPNTYIENYWKTQTFRQGVITKMNELVQVFGIEMVVNTVDMENEVFQKSKTKEDYLDLIVRLIFFIRDQNKREMDVEMTESQAEQDMINVLNIFQNLKI